MSFIEVCNRFGLPPLKEVLSENGVGSFSRYSCFVVVVAATVWVSFLVFKNKALPDLSGLSLYVTGLVAALYGINQAKAVVSAIKGNATDTPNPPTNVNGGANVSNN